MRKHLPKHFVPAISFRRNHSCGRLSTSAERMVRQKLVFEFCLPLCDLARAREGNRAHSICFSQLDNCGPSPFSTLILREKSTWPTPWWIELVERISTSVKFVSISFVGWFSRPHFSLKNGGKGQGKRGVRGIPYRCKHRTRHFPRSNHPRLRPRNASSQPTSA